MATPWSAPLWMKDNGSSVGGSLKKNISVYMQYFVEIHHRYEKWGITIDTVTPQNEPLHGGNNLIMVMTAEKASRIYKKHLGPAFKAANHFY